MSDEALFTAVRAALLAGLPNVTGAPDDIAVKQSGQPDSTGADSGPTVYMAHLGDKPRGSPARTYEYREETEDYRATLRQKYETTLQISGVLVQTSEAGGWTAADLANAARMILQTDRALESLRAAGYGVQRMGDVRNTQFKNGSDAFEYDPNFDFVLTREQTTFDTTPGAVATELRVVSV